jgi:hypothetical protein
MTEEKTLSETFEEMRRILEPVFSAREKELKTLVEDCDYLTKLAVTAWVFEKIVEHGNDPGSFRYLIYDRMGFGADAYVPLYTAGGMTITNEFDLTEGSKDDK